MDEHLDRRQFLKAATATGIGLGLTLPRGLGASPAAEPLAAPPMETVRVGFVGVGHQGTNHLANFLKIEGVEVKAICDLVPDHVQRAQKMVTDAGKPQPAGYSAGPDDFRRMCDRGDLDLVYNATPWETHAPVLLAAMRAGKHAVTEVPMAPTIDELWELVDTAERTQRHCVMMENCVYDRTEMMVLNMVRQGMFGDLLHAECGYLHDLRTLKLTDYYVNRWRVAHSITRNGDLYPTHGLGPVATWLDVNRGNQFDYLVSMGGPSRGLNLWAAEHIGPDSPEAKQRYALSDVVTTLIRTQNGQTIRLSHNTDSPRPYSRDIMLQGTTGLLRKYPDERVYFEKRSKLDAYEEAKGYLAQYDHAIWRELEAKSAGASHGGMDYIEDYRLVQALRAGTPTDLDVYDGAAWSAVSQLTEQSIAGRSRPVDFPDFTRGKWKSRRPLVLAPETTGA
jgi:predicted dehydrogenase